MEPTIENLKENIVDCRKCKTGKIHIDNYTKMKSHQLSFAKFVLEEKNLGALCFRCVHNKIGKTKAKAYKKLNKDFQSIDFYQEVKDGPLDAPLE